MKSEKITLKGRQRIRLQDSEILGASREQIVNKSWVNKQLTVIMACWRLHIEKCNINKQLMVYSTVDDDTIAIFFFVTDTLIHFYFFEYA